MALADLKRLLPMPRLDGSRNLIRQAWELMSGMPGGKAVFSRLVGRMAPYTGSIHAHVTVLRSGYSEVEVTDRKAVRNHLDCVHAIARMRHWSTRSRGTLPSSRSPRRGPHRKGSARPEMRSSTACGRCLACRASHCR